MRLVPSVPHPPTEGKSEGNLGRGSGRRALSTPFALAPLHTHRTVVAWPNCRTTPARFFVCFFFFILLLFSFYIPRWSSDGITTRCRSCGAFCFVFFFFFCFFFVFFLPSLLKTTPVDERTTLRLSNDTTDSSSLPMHIERLESTLSG